MTQENISKGRRAITGASAGLGLALALSGRSAAAPREGPTPEERNGILDLFARYAWSFDCSDVEGVVRTFTADGVIEAQGAEVARGRDAIRAFVARVNAPRKGVSRQHCHDHPVFFREGNEWVVYSYWNVIETDEAAHNSKVTNFGYYVSRCISTKAGWAFSKRSILPWNSARLPWSAQ